MLRSEVFHNWDESLFGDFRNFRNAHQPGYPESIDEYKKFFGPETKFTDFIWSMIRIRRGGKLLAQAILVVQENTSQANLGFLDWDHDHEAAKQLVEAAIIEAKVLRATSLKAPIDFHFFNKYRARLPGGGRPFYGEPVVPDYYHELYSSSGLTVVGKWDTFEAKVWESVKDFYRKGKELKAKKARARKVTIRKVRPDRWDEELQIIHALFSQAYSVMPEYSALTFDQFKSIYDDFRYIINPWYSFIAEVEGRPVGFSINYVDPLPLLENFRNRSPSTMEKLKFVSRRLMVPSLLMKRVLITYQNENSNSRRSWDRSTLKQHAQYVIYGKDL
jgi:hypothetical protein